jgi:hypothetical protein
MDQAQLLSVIGSMYDKFVADVSAKVESNLIQMIDNSINVRIQAALDPKGLEVGTIRQIVRGEIEAMDLDQTISDWFDNNFDITEHEDNLSISDKVDEYLSDKLEDMVRDEVRNLSFSVTLD